uniref:Solute carrier family 46 member 3 n=1 Tax=Timema monikensis TaxID=170555 RepID=A0A7R9HSN5_9NEOP|nr:unnamed protein product [Timema monikensis]
MNLKEKCKHITANITVEPILAAYILPNTLAALATQNLYLEKACRLNLNYSDKVCTEIIRGNGSIYPTEEMNSAELVVYMGGALSGILLRLVGYYGVFSVALAMNIMGFIYCLLKVKEAKPPIPSLIGVAFLRDLFDISHVKETFRVGFKKREGNCRQLIVLLLVLDILLGGPIFGESQLGYYFTRVRLNWNEVNFSLYATYGGIVGLVGPLIEFFGGVTIIAMRSIVSKLVPTTDIGQLNSLFGVCDALTPILYSTVYNTVYANTQETLIGTIYIMSAVLMTPPAIIFIVLAGLATQNLNLEKACQVNLNYGEHICSELTARHTANYTTEETRVQELVAWMTVWKMALSSSFPAVIILFLGSWSDRHARRKPCLLIPIIGEFLTSLGLIVCTYFFMELPMEAAGVVEALFPALTGGWATMFVGVFSYVADVTTDEMRTFRMGVVNVFVSLGMPFGIALSGILFQKIGFYGMFSLSSVLYVMGFTYGILSVKETRPPIPRPEGVGFLKDFFDIRHVKDTLQVAFKHRKGNRRMRVIMIMILSIVLVGPMFGESAINYLFTRYKFNWNEVDYSMYATYTVIVHLIGKMNSLFGICEIAAPLVYSPMYSLVYAFTLKTLPGAVYLLGAALLVPAAAMFMTMYLLQKKDTLNNTVQMNEVRLNNELESKSRTNQAFESDEGDVHSR